MDPDNVLCMLLGVLSWPSEIQIIRYLEIKVRIIEITKNYVIRVKSLKFWLVMFRDFYLI